MDDSRPRYAGNTLELQRDDAFRLLELIPGIPGDSIKIRLLNMRIATTLEYEALSYTWGDPAAVADVQVLDANDDEYLGKIGITWNCYAALCRLRLPDNVRTLWIDAVCINQSLVPEKNHQISLMARIYESASRVIFYLGEEENDSATVIEYFREMNSPRTDGIGRPTPPTRKALQAFFNRPWFHRVWVVHEIHFAADAIFVCGSEELELEPFFAFYHLNTSRDWTQYIDIPFSIHHALNNRESVRTGYEMLDEKHLWGLQGILEKTRFCLATDPRDKVYAILSLVEAEHEKRREPNPHKVIPDYSLSTANVYSQVASIILPTIGLQGLVDLLVPDSAIPNLPSWVPDWSVASPYAWGPHARSYVYAGHRTSPVRLNYGEDPNHVASPYNLSINTKLLQIRAVFVTRLSVVGPVCSVSKNFFPIQEWRSLASPEHHTLHRQLSPFQRCLCADSVDYPATVKYSIAMIEEYNNKKDPDLPVQEDDWLFLMEKTGSRMRPEDSLPSGPKPLGTEPLKRIFTTEPLSLRTQSETVLVVCDGKRFGRTEDGKIGIFPPDAREGDEVWVIEGLRMPMVCRPDVGGRKVVRFVGSAYVYGIMYGEVWNGEVVEELFVR
ncbi:heterokaryon incompatibility protein-domain-containing protein [Podospora fimiseda]|uniref:Heterokaryon incompatibility protein-domain-containing protein n=1 Tax=Podospora fimiseda TaxID=252190 RepID=A0AAN7BJN1_9PEZI|nr:heterokaryon incompatibility protein-domain-containing protein [Podospora fimiseda]